MKTSLRSRKNQRFQSIKSDTLAGENSLFGKYYSNQSFYLNDPNENILFNNTELVDSTSEYGIYLLPGNNAKVVGSSNTIIGANSVNGKTITGNNVITIGNDDITDAQLIQNDNVININGRAGVINPGGNSINIGRDAGSEYTGEKTIAIGRLAGRYSTGQGAISIGNETGNQFRAGAFDPAESSDTICIGRRAGTTEQCIGTIAIGRLSGVNNQSNYSIAIGLVAGRVLQRDYSIAVGSYAASTNQGRKSIAMGYSAGEQYQLQNSIAIGNFCGLESQKANAIAIGTGGTAAFYQAQNSVVIGTSTLNSTNLPNLKESVNSFFIGNLNQSFKSPTGGISYDTPNSIFCFNTSGEQFVPSANRTNGGLFINGCIQERSVSGATSASNNVLYYDLNNYEVYKHMT